VSAILAETARLVAAGTITRLRTPPDSPPPRPWWRVDIDETYVKVNISALVALVTIVSPRGTGQPTRLAR
jgi:hypothetical protein